MIWYYLYNSKNVKNTHGGVILTAKLYYTNGTKSCGFFTFSNLYKWYEIAQSITYGQIKFEQKFKLIEFSERKNETPRSSSIKRKMRSSVLFDMSLFWHFFLTNFI